MDGCRGAWYAEAVLPAWLVRVPGATPVATAAAAGPGAAEIGGKAAGLLRLAAAGLPVPDGWVVTPEVTEQELSGSAGRAALLATLVAALAPGRRLVLVSALAGAAGLPGWLGGRAGVARETHTRALLSAGLTDVRQVVIGRVGKLIVSHAQRS